MNLKDYIASIENYPQEGITFRDISPLMADGNAYSYAIREIVQYATDKKIDMIVGPEARGFIVGFRFAYPIVSLQTARSPVRLRNHLNTLPPPMTRKQLSRHRISTIPGVIEPFLMKHKSNILL